MRERLRHNRHRHLREHAATYLEMYSEDRLLNGLDWPGQARILPEALSHIAKVTLARGFKDAVQEKPKAPKTD